MSVPASPIIAVFARAALRNGQSTQVQHYEDGDARDSTEARSSNPGPPISSDIGKTRGAVHKVLVRLRKARVLKYMIAEVAEHGEKRLPSKTVSQIPELFRGIRQACLMKDFQIWRARRELLRNGRSVSLLDMGAVCVTSDGMN